jgi:hypothetical protein
VSTVKLCPKPGCSRPDRHVGRCGKPNRREMTRLGYPNATRAEINLWHQLNAGR